MSPPDSSGVRRELLAVDDNELVLRVLEDHFGSRGWTVRAAHSGAEALDELHRGMPDVIVSDVLMPVMDGWTFYEAFRRLPGSDQVPFVFLTVESDIPKRVRGLRLGADDYLSKPFDARELHARIDRLLTRRATVAAARKESGALLSGSVEHLAISDLLQILALNGNDGTVVLEEEGREGRIELERGNLVHAAVGRVHGTKALHRMLGWSRARFHVVPRPDLVRERSIEAPATTVLMDGLVALDEWRKMLPTLPPLDAVFRIAPEARERAHASPIGPVEYEVLTRAKGGAPLQAILDDAPAPDAEVAAAVKTLLDRGILQVDARPSPPAS